jgi:hypothetical protein
MPPNIAYRLTPLGASLWAATAPLITWASAHLPDIDAARRRYHQPTVEQHTTPRPAVVSDPALRSEISAS